MGKLEWCGYPTVERFEDTFIRFDRMYERDGRTDRHRMTALAALLHNIARQKLEISAAQWADVALDLEVLYLFTDVSGYIMGGSPPMCLCL